MPISKFLIQFYKLIKMKNLITKRTTTIFSLGIAIVLLGFMYLPSEESLPVYNYADINPDSGVTSTKNLTKKHTVLDFELINQKGEVITHDDYNEKIYVVDFFFTSCPTICPVMTNNMVKIQNEFLNNDEVKLLSLSVTPETDSISVLRKYANNKGVIDTKWNITTGNKKHIYQLARKSYLAVSDDGDGGMQDFIHTSNFILVDKKQQIRGIYNGIDDKEVLRLMNEIRILIN